MIPRLNNTSKSIHRALIGFNSIPCRKCLRQNSTKPVMSKIFGNVVSIVPPQATDNRQSDASLTKSLKLMLYHGFIHHASHGNYHLLPLAMRSLEKFTNIIDGFMREISAQKIDMSLLTPGDLWKKSGRWDLVGPELFRISDRHEKDYCLAATCEEAITQIIAETQISYKQLPILLYQISKKFRDERKPKSGLLRGREFLMKDLYSFDGTIEAAEKTYDLVCQTYSKLFQSLGVHFIKALASSGVIGGSLTHEFHLPSNIGEDKIAVCSKCGYAANVEIGTNCPNCNEDCEILQSIEVGHTFLLGTEYSKTFGAEFSEKDQTRSLLQMGCFGLGVTRTLAALIEHLSSEKEIRWPEAIAPYTVCIISPKRGSKEEKANATTLARYIHQEQINIPGHVGDFLLDDREHLTIGARLRDAKILGFPYIIVVGQQAAKTIPKIELINLKDNSMQYLSTAELFHWFYKTFSIQNDKKSCLYF